MKNAGILIEQIVLRKVNTAIWKLLSESIFDVVNFLTLLIVGSLNLRSGIQGKFVP